MMTNDNEVSDDASDLEDAPAYREKPISSDQEAVGDELFESDRENIDPNFDDIDVDVLPPELREQKRLARRPKIDHLRDGVAKLPNGDLIPLFEEGSRIVVERYVSVLKNNPWLDTRVYKVRSIDDERGIVHCTDEEMAHYACIGFKDPFARVKLAPKKGDPFNSRGPRVVVERLRIPPRIPDTEGTETIKERPKRAKNRPNEEIQAEKLAKRMKMREKREKKDQK